MWEEKTCADILKRAQDYSDNCFGGETAVDTVKDECVDGICEVRADEDTLSLDYRMSEEVEEDSAWKTEEGLVDLTHYSNDATLMDVVSKIEVWTFVDPPRRQEEYRYELTNSVTTDGDTIVTISYYCSSKSDHLESGSNRIDPSRRGFSERNSSSHDAFG